MIISNTSNWHGWSLNWFLMSVISVQDCNSEARIAQECHWFLEFQKGWIREKYASSRGHISHPCGCWGWWLSRNPKIRPIGQHWWEFERWKFAFQIPCTWEFPFVNSSHNEDYLCLSRKVFIFPCDDCCYFEISETCPFCIFWLTALFHYIGYIGHHLVRDRCSKSVATNKCWINSLATIHYVFISSTLSPNDLLSDQYWSSPLVWETSWSIGFLIVEKIFRSAFVLLGECEAYTRQIGH